MTSKHSEHDSHAHDRFLKYDKVFMWNVPILINQHFSEFTLPLSKDESKILLDEPDDNFRPNLQLGRETRADVIKKSSRPTGNRTLKKCGSCARNLTTSESNCRHFRDLSFRISRRHISSQFGSTGQASNAVGN